jgi:hypothetical protein
LSGVVIIFNLQKRGFPNPGYVTIYIQIYHNFYVEDLNLIFITILKV